jgi:hypothetical protein
MQVESLAAEPQLLFSCFSCVTSPDTIKKVLYIIYCDRAVERSSELFSSLDRSIEGSNPVSPYIGQIKINSFIYGGMSTLRTRPNPQWVRIMVLPVKGALPVRVDSNRHLADGLRGPWFEPRFGRTNCD